MKKNDSSSWQDLPLRLISALVIIPVALLCILYGGWFYCLMIAAVSVIMTVEWARLFHADLKKFSVLVFLVWPLVAYAAAFDHMWYEAAFIVLGFAFIFGSKLWMGSAVIGCAGLSFFWLRFICGFEAWIIIWIVGVVIASDSCAYLVGKLVGGPKLMPSVSPGKTWSGAAGGLIGAGCVGSLIIAYLNHGTVNAYWVGAGLSSLIGLVAQTGDLLESKLKRTLGVKDSGKIIPGHGGMLDRCDALLAASIFVAVLTLIIPSELVGVQWNGGLHIDKQFMMKDFQPVPISLFR